MSVINGDPVLGITLANAGYTPSIYIVAADGGAAGEMFQAILSNPSDFAAVVRQFVEDKTAYTPTVSSITRYHDIAQVYP